MQQFKNSRNMQKDYEGKNYCNINLNIRRTNSKTIKFRKQKWEGKQSNEFFKQQTKENCSRNQYLTLQMARTRICPRK